MRHIHFEDAYDAGRVEEIAAFWPEAYIFVKHLLARDWEATHGALPAALASAATLQETAVLIQFAVGAAETEYNQGRRAEAAKLWREAKGWTLDPYCRHLRAVQDGLTYFFAGGLRDAEGHFRLAYRLAEEQGYARGMMKALFHVGLVEADRHRFGEAAEALRQALALAEARGAIFYAQRVQDKLAELLPAAGGGPSGGVPALKKALEAALENGEAAKARALLIEAELLRRRRGQKRGKESLGLYLALVSLALGRPRRAERIFARVEDPVKRLEAFELKRRFFGLGSEEAHEVEYLRESLGVGRIVEAGTAEAIEICGVRIDTLKNDAVKRFLTLLIRSDRAWSKEEIVTELWGLRYDPVLHDRRVYNLIQRCKKEIGVPDLFLNSYGAYRIHPRLRGRSVA